MTSKDRCIADEVFARLREGRLRRESQRVTQWLTREQEQQLERSHAGLAPASSGERNESSGDTTFRWAALSPDRLTASGLRELVAGSASAGEWPNDGESIALRLAAAYPERVADALAVGALRHAEDDPRLASWCVRCLVRMRRWDPAILKGRTGDFPWHYARVVCGEALASSGQWQACAAALGDAGAVATPSLSDRAGGEFYARTGDEAGLPLRLDCSPWLISNAAWEDLSHGSNVQLILEAIQLQRATGRDELLPIHVVGTASPSQTASLRLLAPESYAATAALAELGDAGARELLFWGVRAGVRAARHAMGVDQDEVAWRSGCMPRLLEKVLEHGGEWLGWAKFWVAEGSEAVDDLDEAAFARRLRAVLSNPGGVSASRSPFTGRWGLVPSRDVVR